MEIIIDQMFPHKSYYYRSCFFNSLFPVLNHFEKDIISVMANDTIQYGMIHTERGDFPTVVYQSELPLKQVLSDIGILQKSKINLKEDEIWQEICTDIKAGSPVILWVDCYNLPNRIDTYLQSHIPHTILIYGVDTEKKLCYVIDHKDMESLKYEFKMINYQELYDAHMGYLEALAKERTELPYTSYCLESEARNKEEDFCELSMRYFFHLKENANHYNSNEQIVNLYYDMLEEAISNTDILDVKLNDFLLSMNDIINAKKAEQIKMDYLFGGEFGKKQKEIADVWIEIRIPFARYLYSKRFRANDYKDVLDNINKVKELEKNWCEYLLKKDSIF